MGQCAMLVSAPEHCSRPSNRPNFVRSPLPAAIAADAALYKGIFLDGSVFFYRVADPDPSGTVFYRGKSDPDST